MAEALTPPAAREPVSDERSAASAAQPDSERRAPHRGRFAAAFAALVVLALGVVAVDAALLEDRGRGGTAMGGWSSWRPSAKGAAGAQEIARHVAPAYRLPGGRQLVAVKGGPLQIAGLPATMVLRPASAGGDISFVDGASVLYTLCGLGPRCSISSGRPSEERHLLLRREALELALYTFRYDRGVANVVAMLPPRRGEEPEQLTLFRRRDVAGELDRPLRSTLGAKPPPLALLAAREGRTIERLTSTRLFRFQVQQAQDAGVVVVLEPIRPRPVPARPGRARRQ